MAIHLEPTDRDTRVTKPLPAKTRRPKQEAIAARLAEVGPEYVIFVSAGPEPVPFPIGPYDAYRFEQNRLAWRVPADAALRYDNHHFVQNGRVHRLEDDF